MNQFSLAHFGRYLVALPSLFFLTGCGTSYENPKWELAVTKIVQASEAEGRRGALRNIGSTQFEDDLLMIDAQTKDPMEAFFVLTNKTQYDLRIDWRRAKFVDIYRKIHPVAVTRLPFFRVENLTEGHTEDDGTFTEIKRAQFVRIRLTPHDRPYIRKLSGRDLNEMTGKTVEVSFPVQVEGKSFEYVSIFQITKVKATLKRVGDPL
jgi:hypothetical protein